MMQTAEVWTLTIHWYPRAAEAGVTPCPSTFATIAREFGQTGDVGPAYYNPHEFIFSAPPSREDLLALIDCVPWMQASFKNAEPSLYRLMQDRRQNQVPVISVGYKAGDSPIICDGREVGRIEVRRDTLYQNPGRRTPLLTTSEATRFITRRIRNVERQRKALALLETHKHRINEAIMDVAVRERVPAECEWTMLQGLADVLVEHGVIGGTHSHHVCGTSGKSQ